MYQRTKLVRQETDDIQSQFIQNNTENALKAIDRRMGKSVSLVEEVFNDLPKVYIEQEYEVYHNLGKICSGIAVAYSDGLVTIYVVPDSNPDERDRQKYVRIKVVPLAIVATVIQTDTVTPERTLKFWVN